MSSAVHGQNASSTSFVHDALLYDDAGQLAESAGAFLAEGLGADEAAVVAAGSWATGVIRDAVGDDPRLHVVDRADAYRSRTPVAIAAFRQLADRYVGEGVTRVRVVGEVDFGSTEQDRVEWQRYEAVINHALAPWPLWGLCVFDTQRLPEPVLEAARRTHPTLVTAGRRVANEEFVDPASYLRGLSAPHEALEQAPPQLAVRGVTDFIGLRHAVAGELATTPGPRDVVEDFTLAVDEMTSNAVRHGSPPVDLLLWVSSGKLVCRITDHGSGIDDPFAGYGPAHGDDLSRGGMGLWLARQLCDHVDVSHDGGRTSVRLIAHLR
ncbi:sensor histidine kinase [Blastococcus sp. TF02A-26]|uniref:sensor histidine kinase n=1 Tax=Blastococcus sp. TF02A-26 TaxID=2250577 RepID=UPI001F247FB0|nr:sensor histidine kinase [Blastococcus sp. TF02A-26]